MIKQWLEVRNRSQANSARLDVILETSEFIERYVELLRSKLHDIQLVSNIGLTYRHNDRSIPTAVMIKR
jgi:hypothetical protein